MTSMIGLVLAAALNVVSASPDPAPSAACAYAAERLPRALLVLGDDAVSTEETRATRRALDLPEGALSRAASLTLARRLGATRLVMLRCLEENGQARLEAQAFGTAGPEAGDVLQASRPAAEVAVIVDDLARRIVKAATDPRPVYRAPAPPTLLKVGAALLRRTASERAVGLAQVLVEDPTSIEIRLSLVESLLAARDFDAAARIAAQASLAGVPARLARALRFSLGTALLESGRYAEARDALRLLAGERPSAAVLNNLGVALFRLRDPEGPSVFERAASLPDHRLRDIAFNHSLTLLFQTRAEEALVRLEAAVAGDTGDVRNLLLKVWALGMLKREEERGELWGRLVEQAPSFAALGKPDPVRRLERIFLHERMPTS